ncbi:hypothetical protein RHMOL_Rhmol04G0033600 [Rhododendron molle]|uniref:Uncharacterized protein n=1 Tax=Rhododendron molle TaxID=49168 RepID=A0ACC0NYB3_RHOML|nr:hypothetical protein RHMOL_Rhmol04G0033600 [Rhododendron molle]
MMNVVVALFLVLSSLVVTAVPEAPTQGAIVVEHSTHKLKQVLDKARDVKEHAQEAVSEALSKAKDFVPSKTREVSNKAKGVISAACRISYDFSRTAAAKVSSAVTEKVVPTVNPYVPDERGQAKIGRFAASFVKNAAFYGLPVVFKYWVPGGVPLYNIALRSLRDVETEDYKQVKTKTEHCNEELKKLQAKSQINRVRV